MKFLGTRRLLTALTGLVLVLLVLAGFAVLRPAGADDRTLTATFPRTTSLYAGAKVKVLGVPVGQVEEIKVVGTAVEVTITYDADLKVPADVHALIVPPSIVGDRFIQLAPAYEGGAELANNARLGPDRTGVPVELDDTYDALDKFAAGLGPEGANKDGAFSRLVTATAKNITGHGREFNTAIREFAGAISTLAGSSGDASDTVENLAVLTDTLAGKDAELRALVNNLATVGAELNGQRNEITGSVAELQKALGMVARFAKDNRAELRETVAGVTDITGVLSRRTKELTQLLDIAPVGLTGLANIYIPKNWDPSKPWLTPVAGRAGNANLRAAVFQDLDTQLGFTFSAVCAGLPPEQQVELAPFCSALADAGGSLGGLLSKAIEMGAAGSPGSAPAPGPAGLRTLMGGVG